MSQKNVESFRKAIEAFNDRSVEALMSVLSEDVEFSPLQAALTNTPYHGREGVRSWLAAIDEAFEVFHLDYQRGEAHGDYVVSVSETHARGRVSGAESTQPLVQISRFENGKCVWWQTARTVDEALAAVGLTE